MPNNDLSWLSRSELLIGPDGIDKLQKSLGGIQDLNGVPDAIFIVDVGYHKIAITEANKLGIPVIAIVDTNHSPEGVDYIVPGNDDSSKAVVLYVRGIADAILEGKANAVQQVLESVKEGEEEFIEEGKVD